MAKRSMFVGMDVHKESIDISLAEEGRDGEIRHYGGISGDLEALGKVLGGALAAALKDGDLAYKAGRCLYLHGLAGVKAPRVVFVAAGDGSVKSLRKAMVAGLGLLKGGGRFPGAVEDDARTRHPERSRLAVFQFGHHFSPGALLVQDVAYGAEIIGLV